MPSSDKNRCIVIAGPRTSVALVEEQLRSGRLKRVWVSRDSFRDRPVAWREREPFGLRKLAQLAGIHKSREHLRSSDALLSCRLESESGGLRLEYAFRSPNSLSALKRICRALVG